MKPIYTVRCCGPGESASADVFYTENLMRPMFMITNLGVPERYRGYGYGTRLLRSILADADAEKVELCLYTGSQDPVFSTESLNAWYMHYGFQFLAEDHPLLVRAPGTPIRERRYIRTGRARGGILA